jgi:glycosyltransferase involved in cell wall biosynthesis
VFCADDEREYARIVDATMFDAILDVTHFKTLQKHLQSAAIVNWSVDREAHPGRCAVHPSEAHRRFHGGVGRVVYHGVDVPDAVPAVKGNYFAYLSMFHAPKAPIMAWNAARLAGVRLVMAGPTDPQPPGGAEYVGPMTGADKFAFLAGARALLYPASTESGGLVPLEAQSVGCPVIVVDYGAAKEMIEPGVTGFVARDTVEMVELIGKTETLDRAACVRWVRDCRSLGQMIDGLESALRDAAAGERW